MDLLRVSSTLEKSVGKKNLTDGSPETCWTSKEGTPQFVQIVFDSPVRPRTVHLTFQGGFVGTRCSIRGSPPASTDDAENGAGAESNELVTTVYPEDINGRQSFELPWDDSDTPLIDRLRIVFETSSDFYGRITIYNLQVDGLRV